MAAKLARLRESRQFTVEGLARLLREEGTDCEVETAGGHLLIRGDGRETWEPPVRLAMSDADLQAYVRACADSGPDLWPEVSPVVGGYRLFLIHLDETLATKAVPGSAIRATPDGLVSSPERQVERLSGLDPDGELFFLSPEQYRARFGHEPG